MLSVVFAYVLCYNTCYTNGRVRLKHYNLNDNQYIAVRKFAWQQMDAMWHNQSEFKTVGMIQFDYKDYVVVNPWMDETTSKEVEPYSYYGKNRVDTFITQALERINEKGR